MSELTREQELARNIALADYCLKLTKDEDTTAEAAVLLPYMEDATSAFLAMANIVYILRDREELAELEPLLAKLTDVLTELVPEQVVGVTSAIRFMEFAQDNAKDTTMLSGLYSTFMAAGLAGDWRAICLEVARMMLNVLITRKALEEQSTLAEAVLTELKGYNTEERERLAKLNVGFLWRNYEPNTEGN